MAKSDTCKASINLKAESMPALARAIEQICTDANMQIVLHANVSTAIAIEADDIGDLFEAIRDVARAIGRVDGVECKVSAPGTIYDDRRLDPTPMERMIAESENHRELLHKHGIRTPSDGIESVTLSNDRRSVTLTAETARNASEMLRGSAALFEDE